MGLDFRDWVLLGLLTVVGVAGCATVAPVQTASVCPAAPVYSPEFETRVARAMDALPASSPLLRVVADYGLLRKELRACAGGK